MRDIVIHTGTGGLKLYNEAINHHYYKSIYKYYKNEMSKDEQMIFESYLNGGDVNPKLINIIVNKYNK